MKQKRFLIILLILLMAASSIFASLVLASSTLDVSGVNNAQAQEDDETEAEKTKALAAEQELAQPQQSIRANSGGGLGELFIGVDDFTVPAYTVDVTTNDFFTAFVGVDVWGAAYDPFENRVLFNSGSVLWAWPIGGSPVMLGTMTIDGAAASMVGLAYYGGTLYGSRNIGTEDIYAIDPNTLVATVAITLAPPTGSRDLGGIDADPETGQLYGTNDAAALRGLVQIDPDGTVTVLAPYPPGETDIDGLAVGGGHAYLVTDEPGSIYVFDLNTLTYTVPLSTPWTTSELFSAGAWIQPLTGPHINFAKTVGTEPAACATSDNIEVEPGTVVTYCYRVTNTGEVTFTLHDLEDSELGPILSNFNFSLPSGVTAFLTQTAVITQTTVNTATWTAYNAGPTDVVSDTDSATVEILAVPEMVVSPDSLSHTQSLDTQVTQTLTISNLGTGDLDWSIAELPAASLAVSKNPAAYQPPAPPAPAIVTSAAQCGLYENYAGAEPVGYAQHCLDLDPQAIARETDAFDPNDMGFAHDIGFVSDNVVEFVLNNFPGQTPLSTSAEPLYGYDYDPSATVLYALNTNGNNLGTFDPATGTFTPIGPSTPGGSEAWTGLTIDPLNGTIYASAAVCGTSATLYTLDLMTGAATPIGPMTGTTCPIDIAMNAEGELYTHDIVDDSIHAVDPATGATTPIGLTGFDANFAQGMDFDNSDGTLYIFLYVGGGANVYGTVNLTTGAVTPLAQDNPMGEFEGATQTVACGDDIPWVSASPISGTIGIGSASIVDVLFDSTGLAVGVYTGTLCVFSNDPLNSVVTVPLTMTVVSKTAGLGQLYLPAFIQDTGTQAKVEASEGVMASHTGWAFPSLAALPIMLGILLPYWQYQRR